MQTQHHQQYQFVNIHPTHHKTLKIMSPSPSPISPKTYPMQTQHHQQYQFVNIHPNHQKTLKILPPVSSPMQQIPSPSGGVHHNTGPLTPNSMMRKKVVTTG